jgi:hypothetical protein
MPELCQSCGARPPPKCHECRCETLQFCCKCVLTGRGKNKCNDCIPELKLRRRHRAESKAEFDRLSELHAAIKRAQITSDNAEATDMLSSVYDEKLNALTDDNAVLKDIINSLKDQVSEKDNQISSLKKTSLRLNVSFEELKAQMEAFEQSQAQINLRQQGTPIEERIAAIEESEQKIKLHLKTISDNKKDEKLSNLSKGKSSQSVSRPMDINDQLTVKSARSTLKESKQKRSTLKKALARPDNLA